MDARGEAVTALLAHPGGDRDSILAALEEARKRTWLLASGLDDADLGAAATDYLSPPVWDLGHMANFEELWLVQRLHAERELHAGYNDTYDAFAHPRAERPSLHLLDRGEVRAYMEEVRARTRAVLEGVRLEGDPLVAGGFVYWMIVLHEHQHQETLLQSIQVRGPDRYKVPVVRPLPEPAPGVDAEAWVSVPSGSFEMGIPHGPGVYDNESPPHPVHVPTFELARYPVTVGQYLDFVQAGGYDDGSLWSERGREWLAAEPHHAPMHWEQRGGAWWRSAPTGRKRVRDVADEVLCHVTHFEAEAYARWAGARMPTEAEWEKAARWDPATGATVGRNPWGDDPAGTELANVDQLAWMPSRAGAYPEGAAPCGAEQMVGDVWEWTSSGFEPYPDFRAFPYDEYSKVFFGGDYRVLRGGSWATRAGCATGTFRNWDHPYRRQVFAGVRLAR